MPFDRAVSTLLKSGKIQEALQAVYRHTAKAVVHFNVTPIRSFSVSPTETSPSP
jgi:hypothetical protein